MRWLCEFFRPALICERTGEHSTVREKRHFYRYPSRWFRAITDEVTEIRILCSRCGQVQHDWEETVVRELSGLTMSSERWRELRENGTLEQL
jgi:hypothetical protein